MMLEIKNLHVTVDDKEILKGFSLHIEKGEVVALMGPNGSGKSTLANVLLGNPKYVVTKGDILLDSESILELTPDLRAKKGLFLSFQNPCEIPGVTLKTLLRASVTACRGRVAPAAFTQELDAAMSQLKIPSSFADRFVNEGFSGGEKKRAEILQLAMLKPRYAILDETDSGLDVDALRLVGEGVHATKNKDNGFLVITHYPRILKYLSPNRVVVMGSGKIVQEGGIELAQKIEEKGFEK